MKRLANYSEMMVSALKDSISGVGGSYARQQYDNAYQTVKELQECISIYITKLFSSGMLTEQQSEQTAGFLFVTNNIDRIADRCADIAEETMDGVVFVKLEEEQMEEMKLELEAAAV